MNPKPSGTQVRRETLVVVTLTVVAAILRFWSFGRLGLTHFDEGVYALSGLWSISPRGLAGIDPGLIAYAPPGFSALVGLAFSLLGISDASALLVAILCGVATVPVAAWLGYRTFGPGAGAATATFAALSIAHVAFSRKALTDAPFLFFWLVALGCGGRFLERPGRWRAIALGVAVGVAQNFKYNGALAGLLVILAAIAGLVVDPGTRRRGAILRTFGWGLLAAFVAALVYMPWFLFVESHGGYAALLNHHRSYLGGPGVWTRNVQQQLAQVVALSGGNTWNAASWLTAWIAAAVAACGSSLVATRTRWNGTRFRIGMLFGAGVLAALLDVGFWLGAAWFGWLVADARPARRLIGACWAVLAAMTPFYHPYARLWLPLHAAGWILLAGLVVICGPFRDAEVSMQVDFPRLLRRPGLLARGAFILAILTLAGFHRSGDAPGPFRLADVFQPTESLRDAVAGAVAEVRADSRGIGGGGTNVQVFARRPVAFYLAVGGRLPFGLIDDPAKVVSGPFALGNWLLVDHALARFDPRSGSSSAKGFEYVPVKTWSLTLDPVTRLDILPECVGMDLSHETRRFVLYQSRPLSPLKNSTTPVPARRPLSQAKEAERAEPFFDRAPSRKATP